MQTMPTNSSFIVEYIFLLDRAFFEVCLVFKLKLNLIGFKIPRNALFELLLGLKNQNKHKQLLLNRNFAANKS